MQNLGQNKQQRLNSLKWTFTRLLLLFVIMIFSHCAQNEVEPALLTYSSSRVLQDSINALIGTYGMGCIERSGEWSLSQGTLCGEKIKLPPPLSIQSGNSACKLILTKVIKNCEEYSTHGIPIDGGYQLNGVPFSKTNVCEPDFYANITLDDPDFIKKFPLVKLIVGGNWPEVTSDAIALFDNSIVLVEDESVFAPDDLVDLSGLDIRVDAFRKVIQVSGEISLRHGVTPGQSYALVPALSSNQMTYQYVHSFFSGLPKIPINASISANELMLLGKTLNSPQKYTIIIQNTKFGVSSYQVVTITILAP